MAGVELFGICRKIFQEILRRGCEGLGCRQESGRAGGGVVGGREGRREAGEERRCEGVAHVFH